MTEYLQRHGSWVCAHSQTHRHTHTHTQTHTHTHTFTHTHTHTHTQTRTRIQVSYNRPFFQDMRDISNQSALVEAYGTQAV
jgi:carbohydrate-binding DOMON domain-containing protein